MKKFSFLSSALLLFGVVAFLFMACQKEQSPVLADDSVSESNTITGVAGHGAFQGSIDGPYAAALQQNFSEKYDNNDQTLQVAFSAKDLTAFIASLQKKYKTDIIYVNFGVYGIGAPPMDRKDNGRMTVFFTGNNITNPSGNVKTNGMSASDDDYLNHGGLVP